MGNCLNKTPNSSFDVSLLIQLKQKVLSDVIECYTVLSEDYPECQSVNYDQFTDIFNPLVDDPEPFFRLLQNEGNIEGVVDVYEALAVFAILTNDRFERKAQFAFELFDFDKSGTLELAEVILILQSVLRGLCKFVHITPPSRKSFEEEGINFFKIADKACDNKVSKREFVLWIKEDAELQEFLLKYAGIQTFENLKKRFYDIFNEYITFFYQASALVPGGHADVKILRRLIEEREQGSVKKSDMDFLFEVLLNSTAAYTRGNISANEGKVLKDAFEDVIKAWCAFAASDFDHDNILVIPELHALLWLYEEREPSDERVEFEMNEMKKDGRGGIILDDWMKNLCVIDKDEKYHIRPSLKKLFESFDKDGSGYLSFDELKDVIHLQFQGYANRSTNANVKKDVEEVITGLTKEIFRALDEDESASIGWEEFKKFIEVSWLKMEKLRMFLDRNLV